MTTKPETPKPEMLGHFEQLILTAMTTLGPETYGVPLYDKLCAMSGKRVNQGSLYITLDRLEEKGLLASRQSDPKKEPRGKPKRYYRIEAAGLRALEESLDSAKRLSEILDQNSGSVRRWITNHARKVLQSS